MVADPCETSANLVSPREFQLISIRAQAIYDHGSTVLCSLMSHVLSLFNDGKEGKDGDGTLKKICGACLFRNPQMMYC